MPSRASFITSTKNVSSCRNRPWRPRGGIEVQLYALTTALDGGGWLTPRPGCFTPRGETRYPSNGRLGEPQGQSGRVRKTPPATGIRSPGRQPFASRYTDYAILVQSYPQSTPYLRYILIMWNFRFSRRDKKPCSTVHTTSFSEKLQCILTKIHSFTSKENIHTQPIQDDIKINSK